METIFIVNLTQSSFFRYKKKNENDDGYNKILLELVTPWPEISHWSREDKIIIAPKHIPSSFFDRYYYNELYM
jgi:hypothetical protein